MTGLLKRKPWVSLTFIPAAEGHQSQMELITAVVKILLQHVLKLRAPRFLRYLLYMCDLFIQTERIKAAVCIFSSSDPSAEGHRH